MATAADSVRRDAAHPSTRERLDGGLRFDWAYAFLTAWLVGGVYLDGWAHNHDKVDDVFFTPWHAVLYSGALAIMLFLAAAYARNLARGHVWPRLLPDGYGLSLIGVILFLVGGALDMGWHSLFGVEVDLEALLSPTHLLLATSAVLMVGGPLRAAWRPMPATAPGWRALGPPLISATLILSLLSFFTQYGHPIGEPYAALGFVAHPSGFARALGISGILLQSALLIGMTLLLARQWSLPFGALTLLIGLNSGLMSLFHDTYYLLPATLAAGMLADMLLRRLNPRAERSLQLRLFALAVPIVLYSLYFLTIGLTHGIEWTIHLWMGAIFLAGIMGLLVSFLAAPPGHT